MNFKTYKKFGFGEYETEKKRHKNIKIGDVVIDQCGDVGVVIQIFKNGDFRADSNGIFSNPKKATFEEIKKIRPSLLILKEMELGDFSTFYDLKNEKLYIKNAIKSMFNA